MLVADLVQRGLAPRVLVRSAERAALVPAGARAVVGNFIGDPEGTAAAFEGIDAVFMLNPPGVQETVEGLVAVELARSAGVRRFVYQSCHRLDQMAYIPHLGPKVAIERAVQMSGMEYTFLCPNHFFQNDKRLRRQLVEQGRYVQPIGDVGCWGVDARDIAAAAAIVLTRDGHGGQSYNLVGPGNLTGAQRAAAWAQALGRPIEYIGDIDTWRAGLGPGASTWMNFDVTLMYRHMARLGMLGTPADVERLTGLLGRPPRSFEAYTRECAAAWGVGG